MNAAIISDRTWKASQSWNREVIEDIGGVKVRMRVKVDAYVMQSIATAEIWDGARWSNVHTIPGEAVRACERVSYVSKSVAPAAFDDDIKELRSVTVEVLS